jgi:prevent-host-death family protein
MTRRSTAEARDRIAEALAEVEKTGEPVAFEKDGREVAVLVSASDFHLLQRLREEDEQDQLDAEEADRILSESKPEDFIPWAKVKSDLKL